LKMAADGPITLDSLLDAIDKKVCSNHSVLSMVPTPACHIWPDLLTRACHSSIFQGFASLTINCPVVFFYVPLKSILSVPI
jgi:hypothetical protein